MALDFQSGGLPPNQNLSDLAFVELTASVAANALTVFLTAGNGAAISTSNPISIAFRNPSASTGAWLERTFTATPTLTVPNTATLGADTKVYYVYAILFGGSLELAISSAYQATGSIINTQAIGLSSDDNGLYSTNARSAVPIRYLGRLSYDTAPNGVWSQIPNRVENVVLGIIQANPLNYTVSDQSSTTFGTTGFVTAANGINTLTVGQYRNVKFSLIPSANGYVEMFNFFDGYTLGSQLRVIRGPSTVVGIQEWGSRIGNGSTSILLRQPTSAFSWIDFSPPPGAATYIIEGKLLGVSQLLIFNGIKFLIEEY